MAEKVTQMTLEVDLQCPRCYKKVKKILCKIPQIRDQVYDEKKNLVTITVVSCCPEKIRDKLYCKGGKVIKCIKIVVPKKPDPPPPPPPKPCEKKCKCPCPDPCKKKCKCPCPCPEPCEKKCKPQPPCPCPCPETCEKKCKPPPCPCPPPPPPPCPCPPPEPCKKTCKPPPCPPPCPQPCPPPSPCCCNSDGRGCYVSQHCDVFIDVNSEPCSIM